jgi:hypothetical protein
MANECYLPKYDLRHDLVVIVRGCVRGMGELLKAMDGHVVGKAAWFGRFHAQPTL